MPVFGTQGGFDARQLTRRYTIALLLIGGLTLFSQWVVQQALSAQVHDSRLINVAGRQRMLSQKITRIAREIAARPELPAAASALTQLQASLGAWERAHAGLQRGDRGLGLPGDNDEAMAPLFDELAPHYARMTSAGKAILADPGNVESVAAAARQIAEHEGEFLRAMDAIVFRYDAQARARVEFTRTLEIGLAALTLLVLVLEAWLIFAPAARRLRADRALRARHEADLEKLFAASPAAMFVVDRATLKILRINQKAERLMDSAGTALLYRPLADFIDEQIDVNRRFLHRLRADEAATESVAEFEVVLIDAHHRRLETLISNCRIIIDERPVYVLGITNVGELRQAREHLQYYATFDELTGLTNRRTGLLLLHKEIERARRDGTPVTLVLADIDGLKRTNDQFGHHEGDWLIRAASRVLAGSIRDGDVAIRLGGDEFLLVLHDCSPDEAGRLTHRIARELAELPGREAKPFALAASFGVCAFDPDRHRAADDAIAEAETRMYEARRSQRPMEPPGQAPVESPDDAC